ncbi:hypothetical protein [Pseudomonas sp. PH1b]|uniref:hypothetical protein n=1 Tax=Pseudomonas sp. PH1b TaxID=1397282 RepID=UPI0012FF48CD|nr:hypothetical protein [Pseudomonas sp. PH1b]
MSDYWDFSEEVSGSPRSIAKGRYTLEWRSYSFPSSLQVELKTIFGIYILSPSSFIFSKGAEIPGASKVYSLMPRIKRALNFIAAVVDVRFLKGACISTIMDIFPVDLIVVAKTYSGRSFEEIRRGLKVLFHLRSSILIGGEFRVKQFDIDALVFMSEVGVGDSLKSGGLDGSPRYFSDRQFSVLTERALSCVHDFIGRCGLDRRDSLVEGHYKVSPGITDGHRIFIEDFELYVEYRKSDVKSGCREKLKRAISRPLSEMRNYTADVNHAALCVLGLYLGPRYSEMASMRVDCLEERMGVLCVVGRVTKRRGDHNLYDDAWVAIPALEDAIVVLKFLAELKQSDYLFAPCTSITRSGRPFLDKSLASAIGAFLKTVNYDGVFDGLVFGTHYFKHSLSRQMVRARLGLPYISYQLKHLYGRAVSLPSDVTLSYGNAAKLIQSQQSGATFVQLKKEMAQGVFDPDNPIYGGSAAEISERRVSFFKGMTDAGLSREEMLEGLIANNVSLVNVGLAYCTGVKPEIEGGPPPCVGQLKCNPMRCSNSIITKDVHGPAWKKLLQENKDKAVDARFYYAREHFEAAVKEAESVCVLLGVELNAD